MNNRNFILQPEGLSSEQVAIFESDLDPLKWLLPWWLYELTILPGESDPDYDDEAIASIYMCPQNHNATLFVYDAYWRLDIEARRYRLTHEIIHGNTGKVVDFVESVILPLVKGKRVRRLLSCDLHKLDEEAVDTLAISLTRNGTEDQ